MHVRGSGEGGRLRTVQIELAKTLKKIGTNLLSIVNGDREVGTWQWTTCPKTAIENHTA